MKAKRCAAIVQAVESTSEKLPVDCLVFTFTEWRELSIRDESECQPLAPILGLNIAHFLGALGMPAITAYYGLKDVVKAQPGEMVVVSGAAGAAGSMAVQIPTKLLGRQVIMSIAFTSAAEAFSATFVPRGVQTTSVTYVRISAFSALSSAIELRFPMPREPWISRIYSF